MPLTQDDASIAVLVRHKSHLTPKFAVHRPDRFGHRLLVYPVRPPDGDKQSSHIWQVRQPPYQVEVAFEAVGPEADHLQGLAPFQKGKKDVAPAPGQHEGAKGRTGGTGEPIKFVHPDVGHLAVGVEGYEREARSDEAEGRLRPTAGAALLSVEEDGAAERVKAAKEREARGNGRKFDGASEVEVDESL